MESTTEENLFVPYILFWSKGGYKAVIVEDENSE
jgi:hypothetical protein